VVIFFALLWRLDNCLLPSEPSLITSLIAVSSKSSLANAIFGVKNSSSPTAKGSLKIAAKRYPRKISKFAISIVIIPIAFAWSGNLSKADWYGALTTLLTTIRLRGEICFVDI
jgi:hypothetical protein